MNDPYESIMQQPDLTEQEKKLWMSITHQRISSRKKLELMEELITDQHRIINSLRLFVLLLSIAVAGLWIHMASMDAIPSKSKQATEKSKTISTTPAFLNSKNVFPSVPSFRLGTCCPAGHVPDSKLSISELAPCILNHKLYGLIHYFPSALPEHQVHLPVRSSTRLSIFRHSLYSYMQSLSLDTEKYQSINLCTS